MFDSFKQLDEQVKSKMFATGCVTPMGRVYTQHTTIGNAIY